MNKTKLSVVLRGLVLAAAWVGLEAQESRVVFHNSTSETAVVRPCREGSTARGQFRATVHRDDEQPDPDQDLMVNFSCPVEGVINSVPVPPGWKLTLQSMSAWEEPVQARFLIQVDQKSRGAARPGKSHQGQFLVRVVQPAEEAWLEVNDLGEPETVATTGVGKASIEWSAFFNDHPESNAYRLTTQEGGKAVILERAPQRGGGLCTIL
jgi:hypothetical protein